MLKILVLPGRWRVIGVATTPGWSLAVDIDGILNPGSIRGWHNISPGVELGVAEGDDLVVAFGGSYSGPNSAGGFGPLVPSSEYKWVPNVGLTVRVFLSDDDLANLGLSAMEVVFIDDDQDNPVTFPRLDLTIPESLIKLGHIDTLVSHLRR